MMIQFNQILENLNTTATRSSTLRRYFSQSQPQKYLSALVTLISSLDTHKKGYFTC